MLKPVIDVQHQNKVIAVIVVIALFLGFVYLFGVPLQEGKTEVKSVFVRTNVTLVQVTASTLNVRSGAGTNHSVIGTVSNGQILVTLGQLNGWYVVKLDNDAVGCVSGNYVKPYSSQSQTLITQTPAPTPTPTPTPVPQPTPSPTPTPTPSLTPSTGNFTAEAVEMLAYINAERAKVGAKPLTLDAKLTEGATVKSKDMAVNGYFSHTSPTYGSPFDMMKRFGISYSYAGENIAKHFSVKGAHDAFMNSPGHRANILNGNYGKVGLGFVRYGNYLYVTQWFTN